MEILENIPLAQYTSIRIGGPARFFCVVKNEQELGEALEFARGKNIPVCVEYVGIEKSEIRNSKFETNSNIKIQKLNNPQCFFDYRESIFKKHPEWIIWRAVIQLRKGEINESQNKIQEYLAKKRQGQDLENKSAGCTFKNPKLPDNKKFMEYLRKSLEMEEADFNELTKNGQISAGFLIDRLDLKGKKIGGIQISLKHANFLINTGNATADDVVIMMSLIKEKVRNHFDIQLQDEIQLIGFCNYTHNSYSVM